MKLIATFLASTACLTKSQELPGSNNPIAMLYCMHDMHHLPNPNELPNDRCCPILETEGIQGVPFSSTTKGCCQEDIYDLEFQHCCASGIVLNINDNIEAPWRLNSWVGNDDTKNGFATISLAWPVVSTADNYEVSVGAAYNETWKDPEGSGLILGAGETMGLSTTMLQNVQIGYNYDVKVRAIDCLNRNSDWLTETVEARV